MLLRFLLAVSRSHLGHICLHALSLAVSSFHMDHASSWGKCMSVYDLNSARSQSHNTHMAASRTGTYLDLTISIGLNSQLWNKPYHCGFNQLLTYSSIFKSLINNLHNIYEIWIIMMARIYKNYISNSWFSEYLMKMWWDNRKFKIWNPKSIIFIFFLFKWYILMYVVCWTVIISKKIHKNIRVIQK